MVIRPLKTDRIVGFSMYANADLMLCKLRHVTSHQEPITCACHVETLLALACRGNGQWAPGLQSFIYFSNKHIMSNVMLRHASLCQHTLLMSFRYQLRFTIFQQQEKHIMS